MSVARSVGSFVCQAAAYAVEGTRLVSTEFAAGGKQGYAKRAALLRAKREAVIAGLPPVVVPQAKVRVAKVKA